MDATRTCREASAVLLAHWGLGRDPFAGSRSPYVATPAHEEAVGRIVQAVESGERRLALVAGAGLGKTFVVAEALARLRHPRRRAARTVAPADGAALLAELAIGLGRAVPDAASRAGAWRAFSDALRLCRVQGQSVVLVVEDAQWLPDRDYLERFGARGGHLGIDLTVLETARPVEGQGMPEGRPWHPIVGLPALTRGEADAYLRAKLLAAGRAEPIFTPRCASGLHALARGVPGDLDRLASRALRSGAARKQEMIGCEVVEELAEEFEAQASWS